MKKVIKGSFTIEAAVVVPLILFVFSILMNTLFYYHDKNIIAGVAHETAAISGSREEVTEAELETYFTKKIQGKLLLFSKVNIRAEMEEKKVELVCRARKSKMSLEIAMKMERTNPENYIRKIRKIEKIGEGIGKQGETILQK